MAGAPETPESWTNNNENKGSTPPKNTLPKPILAVPEITIGTGSVPPQITLPAPPTKPLEKPGK